MGVVIYPQFLNAYHPDFKKRNGQRGPKSLTRELKTRQNYKGGG